MHVYKAAGAPSVEPAGHYGGLAVSDAVGRDITGNFSVQLSYCPPGGGGESHHHTEDSQLFMVIQGELTFDTGSEVFTLGPKDSVMFAPGEDHATHNNSDEDSVSVVVTVKTR